MAVMIGDMGTLSKGILSQIHTAMSKPSPRPPPKPAPMPKRPAPKPAPMPAKPKPKGILSSNLLSHVKIVEKTPLQREIDARNEMMKSRIPTATDDELRNLVNGKYTDPELKRLAQAELDRRAKLPPTTAEPGLPPGAPLPFSPGATQPQPSGGGGGSAPLGGGDSPGDMMFGSDDDGGIPSRRPAPRPALVHAAPSNVRAYLPYAAAGVGALALFWFLRR
jgi:hypothetical protein